MKRWLILELLILFGVTTWIYFFPDEVEFNFAKGFFGFGLIYFIETLRNVTNDKKEAPKKGTSEEKNKMFKTELDWASAYKELEEDNEDLKQSLDWANEREKEYVKRIAALEEANAVLIKRIKRAKRCMKKLMFVINSYPANYNCKGLMQDAEDFIHNRICNIRQLGEHCISETRCIMCDMEDKDD